MTSGKKTWLAGAWPTLPALALFFGGLAEAATDDEAAGPSPGGFGSSCTITRVPGFSFVARMPCQP